jgi:hypothetical protein
MKILVACEYSGTVRDAFRDRGHDAMSCDLLPTDRPGPHHTGDVHGLLAGNDWDMVIAFPPCTYLTVSGNRWLYHPEDRHLPVDQRRPHPKFPNRQDQRDDGADFFMSFVDSAPKVVIENPVGIMSTRYRKPDQIVQPWMHGHPETKATCFWLKGLAPLVPTNIVEGREQRLWKLPPTADRAKLRSKTYEGIAQAMADQWG